MGPGLPNQQVVKPGIGIVRPQGEEVLPRNPGGARGMPNIPGFDGARQPPRFPRRHAIAAMRGRGLPGQAPGQALPALPEQNIHPPGAEQEEVLQGGVQAMQPFPNNG